MRMSDITENWIGQYLEWTGADERAPMQDGWEEAMSFASEASEDIRVDGQDALLAVLRAESDCVHLLRGIIDGPSPRPQAVKEACAALEHLAHDAHAVASRVLARPLH